MKKFLSLVMVALLLGTVAGCKGKSSESTKLNDSLATEIGEMIGTGLKAQFSQAPEGQFDQDMFIKGVEAALKADTTKRTTSYNAGFMTGMQIYQQLLSKYDMMGIEMDRNLVINELKKAFNSKDSIKMDDPASMQKLEQKMQALQASLMKHDNALIEAKGAENIKAGKEYIAEQQKKDKAFKVTASGVAYKVIEEGKGNNFSDTSVVDIIYVGKLIKGKQFDSSNGEAKALPLMGVVPGFREVVMQMKPGSHVLAIIPGELGYGEQGNPRAGIGPNETLIFDITTVKESQKPEAGAFPGGRPAPGMAPGRPAPGKPAPAPGRPAPGKPAPGKMAPGKPAPAQAPLKKVK